MKFYTIGYGGRVPSEFVDLLLSNGIRSIVDVRLRPDRASMGAYVRAKSRGKGIERLLEEADIEYCPAVALGNVFMECEDWRGRYQALLERAGDLLLDAVPLDGLPKPVCLLCAEKNADDCHRRLIGDHLVGRGHEVVHL